MERRTRFGDIVSVEDVEDLLALGRVSGDHCFSRSIGNISDWSLSTLI